MNPDTARLLFSILVFVGVGGTGYIVCLVIDDWLTLQRSNNDETS